MVKINELLSEEQIYEIMEQQGCHKTGKMDKASKEFGKEHSGKSLVEKFKIMASDKDAPFLIDNKTIGFPVRCYVDENNGILHSCHCISRNYEKEYELFIENYPNEVISFSKTFCGCCAGHQNITCRIKLIKN
jgi:hypothetical protein